MKYVLVIIISALSLIACQSSDQQKTTGKQLSDEERRNALKDSASFTTIEWLDSTYRDLGTKKEGEKVEVSYHFKNTGKNNLIISDVSASCGCTTPDWPKQPIPPGQEQVIKAVFNSENRVGENRKDVHVLANTVPQSSMTLSFRVEITK